MLEQLINIIEQYNWRHCKVLLALSGGIDSMTMAQLFVQVRKYLEQSPYGLAGFDMAVAHCNFHLRGADSDSDAALVRDWCARHQVACYQKDFDTPAIIQQEGANVQIVARRLRYEWFESLRQEIGFDCIATAHHRQDSVETLLMNFFKGTGIAGLHGILPEQKRIIRPMLYFSRQEISAYATAQGLVWREDASNQKDDYLRNRVRHHLLPQITELFPKAGQQLFDNTLRMAEAEQLYRQSIDRYRKMVQARGKDWYIPLRKLKHCTPLRTITYELLKPYGLSPAQLPDVLQLMESSPGHFIPMGAYRLVRDREFLIITPQQTQQSDHILITSDSSTVDTGSFILRIKKTGQLPPAAQITPNDLYLEVQQISFPLVLRPWREGDYLYPFGMGMKKKKVKKMLIDAKVPIHEKAQIWVLEDRKKIIWLCGMRSDERFKVNPRTTELLHFSYHKKD